MLAIQATRAGGPEVLEAVEVEAPAPGPGQIRVRNEAIGLNFIDTYQRSGLYPVRFPAVLGQEAAGVVDAVGDGRDALQGRRPRRLQRPARRLCRSTRSSPPSAAVALPDGVSFEAAAASLLKGMTTEFLVRRCYAVQAGETVLRPRRGRRGRHAAGAVAEGAGRNGDRHGRLGREGRAGAAARLRPRDLLPPRGRRRAGAGDHRRRRRAGRLRLGRQGHLRGDAEEPGAPGAVRQLRQRLRRGPGVRAAPALAGRLALLHPPDAVRLHGHRRRARRELRARCSR